MKYFYFIFLFVFALFAQVGCSDSDSTQASLKNLALPPGYAIQIFVDNLPGSRTLARSDAGVIFVGTRGQGKVYAVIPPKNPQDPIQVITLLSGLNEPNGVAYYQGDLYVAEIHRIVKYEQVDKHLDKMPEPIILTDSLPKDRWHGYRVIKIGPDEKLYVGIGMHCNTCFERDKHPIYGTIQQLSLDESHVLKPYAIGVRNSVGFGWHPLTHELWFTDNGQDLLGDNIPPDEINRAYKPGLDFGFPYVYDNNTLAPGYTSENIKGLSFEPPVFELPAHVAPLGMIFKSPTQMLVALHGSWNRSQKVGYEVIELTLEGNRIVGSKPFVTGWLQGQKEWGRPVDFLILPDQSILITDDMNGVIYQVRKTQ